MAAPLPEHSGIEFLPPGTTVGCLLCGVSMLVVRGVSAPLLCHGEPMLPRHGVSCLDAVVDVRAPTVAGMRYLEPASGALLRCTRSGTGEPATSAGALEPLGPLAPVSPAAAMRRGTHGGPSGTAR
jgi:hypothetical protein